jgi:hypothetical protein
MIIHNIPILIAALRRSINFDWKNKTLPKMQPPRYVEPSLKKPKDISAHALGISNLFLIEKEISYYLCSLTILIVWRLFSVFQTWPIFAINLL